MQPHGGKKKSLSQQSRTGGDQDRPAMMSSMGAEKKVTFTTEQDRLRPRPTHHDELHDHNILFPEVMDKLNRALMVFISCEE